MANAVGKFIGEALGRFAKALVQGAGFAVGFVLIAKIMWIAFNYGYRGPSARFRRIAAIRF